MTSEKTDVLIEHHYDHNRRVCICHRDVPGQDRQTLTEREHAGHVLSLLDAAKPSRVADALDAAAADVARLAKGLRHGARHLREQGAETDV